MSGLGGSMYKSGGSVNASFNSSGMSFSRRAGRQESGVIMSSGMTQSAEPHGVALPAMVKVALASSAGEQGQHSCRLDPNGWAWLVSGRRLYVWRHSPEGTKKSTIVCRELALPPSELVHSANLVCVVALGATPAPSVVAVSPEGHITFWPNIANESSTVTLNADIPGQECDSLTSLWPTGCVLTTTSATILLIKPAAGRGNKPSLVVLPLGIHKGWLGGWSKKMSTMLFTTMPAAGSGLDHKRARIIVPLAKDDDPSQPGNSKEGKVYIFQGSTMQVWQMTPETHNCLSEHNIDESIRRQFLENVWAPDEDSSSDLRGIQSWILDVTSLPNNSKKLAIFAAAKSQFETADNLVYGIVLVDMKNLRRREGWSFVPVTSQMGTGVSEDEQLYTWKILAAQNFFYVISTDAVLTATDKSEVAADSIESSQFGGPIIGAGIVAGGTVAVLVARCGLYTIKHIPSTQEAGLMFDETFSEIRVPDHLALSVTHSILAESSSSEESVNRYKSAFLMFLQKKQEECSNILLNLFPPNIPSMAPQDPLDLWTVAVCKKLIDEAPVSDPRWVSSFGRKEDPDPIGMKSKILIKNFLMDKKEGLELFFGFLSSVGISSKLQGIVVKEDAVATNSLLYNDYEKVYFALSLQNMQSETNFRKSLDKAIKSIVTIRSEKEYKVRSTHLSPNDIFYKEISRIHQVIPALISIEEEELSKLSPKEIPARIIETNEIILRGILEVSSAQPGEKLDQIYDFLIKSIMGNPENKYEVLPWVVQSTVLSALFNQQKVIIQSGLNNSELTVESKLELLRHLQQYTDLILDGLKVNLESVQGSERYQQKLSAFESNRTKLLRSHMDIGDYVGASQLAEKYLDFEVLVSICYDTKDVGRMEAYFDKYDDLSFPEFTFEWFVKQKKTAELIDSFSRSSVGGKLKRFLDQHPKIAWHHSTLTEDYSGAANILKDLADSEEALLDDKKFMLCMAKLAALAADQLDSTDLPDFDKPIVREIDMHLKIVQYQNQLPANILQAFGLERSSMRVLSPSEMIDMYSTSEVEPDAENYWNAYCLADLMINYELRREKILVILSRVIKRDPWDTWATDHPMDVIQKSSLYQFLITALERGETLEEVYPLMELATFPEMETVLESANTKFLLRACHEHLSVSSDGMGDGSGPLMED